MKKKPKIEFEYLGYLEVISHSAESARAFFGLPETVKAIAVGLPRDPERWVPGTRVWRLYPDDSKQLALVKK